MGYAVYHTEKSKSTGGGLGNHIDRVKGMEHTYPHADPSKIKNNHNLKVYKEREKIPLAKAVSERITEGYKGNKKIRTDAVKYLSHVFTGTHEDMLKIFSNNESANKWIEKNADFAKNEFGAKNIIRFTLHLDEKTPHLHVVTVPLTADGRLSAKEILGNKKQMQARQDRYAEQMKSFGLERGIRGTGIKHENAKDYYKRIEQARDMSKNEMLEPVKGFLGIDKSKTIEKQKNDLKTLYLALKEKEEKERKNNLLVKRAHNIENTDRTRITQLENKIFQDRMRKEESEKKLKLQFKEIIMHPEKTKIVREKYISQAKKRGHNLGL